MYTVYKIINHITNEFYIGVHKTNNINDSYYGSGIRIKRAIKKYGKSNFSKLILFVLDEKELAYEKEKEILKEELTNVNCLNLSDGGVGGSNFAGKQHTEETKNLIRQTSYGRVFSLESRKKISEANKKRPISDSFREKMRKIATGRKKTNAEIEKIRNARLQRNAG